MLTASDVYQTDMKQNADVYIKAVIENDDYTPSVRTIYNKDIVDRNFRFTDSCSQQDRIEIGSCVINEFDMTVVNDSTYDNSMYAGAKVTLFLGRNISGGLTYVKKGEYYIQSDGYFNDVLHLVCYDKMVLLDVPFDSSDFYTEYKKYIESTVSDYIEAIETQIGIQINCSSTVTTVVSSDPGLMDMTCREVLFYICQMICCYARFNHAGILELKWHKTGVSKLDADIDYTVYVVDNYSLSKPVLIDGVSVTGMDDHADYRTCGDTLYTLLVKDNPFITSSNYLTVTTAIDAKCKSKYIQPLTCRIQPFEIIEAGDKVLVVGKDGEENGKVMCITNIEYDLGEPMLISMGAETKEENLSNRGVSQIEKVRNDIRSANNKITEIKMRRDEADVLREVQIKYDDAINVEKERFLQIEYNEDMRIKKIGGVTISNDTI